MIPVICKSPEDIAELAKEMRIAATATPDDVQYTPSGSVEEAEKKAPSVAEMMLSRGILRFLSYNGRMPTNICFTLREEEEDFSEWNLSISHATLEGPVRVDDELASIIVGEFLGEGYQEVPPKAVWDTVRHFIKLKED